MIPKNRSLAIVQNDRLETCWSAKIRAMSTGSLLFECPSFRKINSLIEILHTFRQLNLADIAELAYVRQTNLTHPNDILGWWDFELMIDDPLLRN